MAAQASVGAHMSSVTSNRVHGMKYAGEVRSGVIVASVHGTKNHFVGLAVARNKNRYILKRILFSDKLKTSFLPAVLKNTIVYLNTNPFYSLFGRGTLSPTAQLGSRGYSVIAQAAALKNEILENESTQRSSGGVTASTSAQGQEEATTGTDSRCFQLKYRPRRFEDLVGHEFIAKVLCSHIEKNAIKPAYLFSGPKGSGKTSAARIFAAAMNCTSERTGKREPCGRCRQCRSARSGTNPDIREIDAASNSGVDSIRSLLETVRYSPVSASFKVYIIDECHMLSKEAANALLKTLEEPPPHVVFILVTTDPQKLLEPVVSRCHENKFRRIPDSEAVSVMKRIAQKEKIEVEDGALKLISQLADGSLRDATKMLETVSCLGEKVTVDIVEELLGVVPTAQVMSVLANAFKGDQDGLMCKQLETVLQEKEPWQVLMRLTQLLVDLLTGEPHLKKPLSNRTMEQSRRDLIRLQESELGKYNMRKALSKLQEAEMQVRQAPVPSLWLKSSLMQLPLIFCAPPSQVMIPFPKGNSTFEEEEVFSDGHTVSSEFSSSSASELGVSEGKNRLNEEETVVFSPTSISREVDPKIELVVEKGEEKREDLVERSPEIEGNSITLAEESISEDISEEADSESGKVENFENFDALKAKVLELITVKTHKTLLSSKGAILSISQSKVTLGFPEGLVPKATKPKPLQVFKSAFSQILGFSAEISVEALSSGKGESLKKLKVVTEIPQEMKSLPTESTVKMETKVETPKFGYRKAEDDDFNEKFTEEDSKRAWDLSDPKLTLQEESGWGREIAMEKAKQKRGKSKLEMKEEGSSIPSIVPFSDSSLNGEMAVKEPRKPKIPQNMPKPLKKSKEMAIWSKESFVKGMMR